MSIFRESDPRAVIFANIAASAVGLFVRDLLVLLAALACTAAFAWLLGAEPLRVIIKLRRLLVIIAGAALLQSMFVRAGDILVQAGGFVLLTSGGLTGGALVLLRMSILLMSGAAISSCGARRNIQALVQLKLPYELAFMVCVGLHFIPVLAQELQDSLIAVQLRGVDLRNIAVRKRVQVYTYILLPAMGSAIVKAQDLAASIELRGFRAYAGRTSLIRLKMRALDYIIIALSAGGAAGVLIFRGFA